VVASGLTAPGTITHNRLSDARRVYSGSGAWSTQTPVECVFDNGGSTPVQMTHL
jgi:hypothetical protein